MFTIADMLSPKKYRTAGYNPEEELENASPQNLSLKIQEWLGARQPEEPGKIQNILAGRFEPTGDEVGRAAVETLFSRKPVDSQQFADQRMAQAMEQMEAMRKAKMEEQELGLKNRMFEETVRSNRATEGLAAQRIGASKGGGRKLSASEQKELFNLQDTLNAGQNVISSLDSAISTNDQAVSGFGAGTRRDIGRNAPFLSFLPGIPDQESVNASTDLETIVTGQALENLKAIFGGMPTEGERKILLEMQGSLNKSPEERELIFKRAQQMAALKIRQNQDRAQQILTGEYRSSPTSYLPDAIDAQNDDSDLLEYMTPEERALFE